MDTNALEGRLESRIESMSAAFDKIVVTLAGGGLGVALTVARGLGGRDPDIPWVLTIGIALLVAALVGSMASLMTSEWAFRVQLTQLREEHDPDQLTWGAWGRATNILNFAAAVLVVVGITAVAVFATFNIGTGGGSL